EEACTAILARLRMADHRSVAVVDLCFFPDRRRDDDARLGCSRAAQVPHEAADTGVASREAVLDQVLPDRHRIASARERGFDAIAMRLTRTRLGSARGKWRRPPCRRGVGGRLRGNGRFSIPFSWSPASADRNTGRLQIIAD